MDIILIFIEWFLVVIVFSSVVAAAKILLKKQKKSKPLIIGLVTWIVLGLTLFCNLFFHAEEGYWIWQDRREHLHDLYYPNEPRYKTNQSTIDTPAPQPYANTEYNFSIYFPEGWTIKKPITSGSIVIKAIHRDEHENFAALNIYVQEADDTFDFAALTPEQLFTLSYGEKGELFDFGEEIINSRRALWMKIKVTSGILPIYAINYTFFNDKKIFNLFGNTALGGIEWFEANEEILKSSIRTFKFIQP